MFWRIKLFPQFIPSLKHIKMFWIFNSHQALATRSWLWRELLDVNYRMLSPNLPWSLSCCFLVSPRFSLVIDPCFTCVNYFSKQFSASPLAFWCVANWIISAKIILWLLSWLWVISLLFFGPLTDFYHLVLCFIIKHPFYLTCDQLIAWRVMKHDEREGFIKRVDEYSLGPAE